MNPQRYQEVKAIFMEACERDADQRENFVNEACGGDDELRRAVEHLFKHDSNATNIIDADRMRVAILEMAKSEHAHREGEGKGADDEIMPQQIGRYRILRKLGEGGMGIVYQAQQESPNRTVALKLMTSGLASRQMLRRFEHETQLLGRLQHPGIAQIFEAGTFDTVFGPQPYFAMELVEGQPLLAYVQTRSASLRDRLALFAKVCDAIEHAHQKGVIHRDLKPANILVVEERGGSVPISESRGSRSSSGDAGQRDSEHPRTRHAEHFPAAQPKVLDFGVARAVDADLQTTTLRTNSGQLLGTLSYMSPEQAAGDAAAIDTRSDVYALGVVLYQLLTGTFPYSVDGSMRQVVDNILTAAPIRPGTIDRTIDDEVETIILKCLSKEPDRRYQSAGELARDIRLYIAGEPIQAKRDSRVYVLRKTLRRHWAASAAAVGFVFLITAGLIVSISLWRSAADALKQAELERARAVAEAGKASAVNDFLNEMLTPANPEFAPGREVSVRETLDDAARLIAIGRFRDQPEIESAVRLTIGEAYLALGRMDDAGAQFDRALELRRQLFGPNHPQVAQALDDLADLNLQRGNDNIAEPLSRQALDIMRRNHPGDHEDVAITADHLGRLLWRRGKTEEAVPLLREALDIYRRLPGDQQRHIAAALGGLAMVMHAGGDIEQAQSMLGQAIAIAHEKFGPDDPATINLLETQATLLHLKHDYPAAEKAYLDVIERTRALYGPDHPFLLSRLDNLSFLYTTMGDHERETQVAGEALALARKAFGNDSQRVAQILISQGRGYFLSGNREAGDRNSREALGILQRLGRDHEADGAAARDNIATSDLRRGELDEAQTLVREVLSADDKTLPPNHWTRGQAHALLGDILTRQGQFAQAEPELLKGYEMIITSRVGGPYPAAAIKRLVDLYDAWDKAEPGTGQAEKAAQWRGVK